MPGCVIADVDPQGEEAMALLHDAWVDAKALYPELFDADARPPTNPPLGERGVYVVARVEGRAAACGALRSLDRSTAEVRRMYVHREHRRRGLARKVLAHLEREALRLGFCRLVLETGFRQTAAMRLYESAGYRRIAAFGEHAQGPTSVCYERLLAVPGRHGGDEV